MALSKLLKLHIQIVFLLFFDRDYFEQALKIAYDNLEKMSGTQNRLALV